ncbi:tyrosine-type DNA invertase [Trabulsiella odontotermitis]|uniref:DNA recombinase n=1 Tax=Trabulsiella odontotermitis TaxID=379893 RepID=A0A0L0GKR2_9ENTR|nr:tyrosine-type DNA invertase [Trabulsiella odontotermitis]KNC89459.1 DNA recombinase [Trabulsiella odontotermitis]KNC94826.1 DNA recombinase [Trabulsiella odontotermitis]
MPNRKHLTTSEINEMLSASLAGKYPERDWCLIQMCFLHGLRASEACQLRTSDIDLRDKVIYIRRLKGGFSTVHPLTQDELPHLKRWIKQRNQMRGADSEWLFLSQKGGQLSRKHVYTLIKRYGEAANISVTSHPHMLRHACGYALADSGADTRLIQDYLGHRNIRHTVIYTASNPQRFTGLWQKGVNRK